jgi:hypothetical protein
VSVSGSVAEPSEASGEEGEGFDPEVSECAVLSPEALEADVAPAGVTVLDLGRSPSMRSLPLGLMTCQR